MLRADKSADKNDKDSDIDKDIDDKIRSCNLILLSGSAAKQAK